MKKRLARKKEIEKAWQTYRKNLEDHHEIDNAIIDERIQTETLIDATASANFMRESAAKGAAPRNAAGGKPSLRVTEPVEEPYYPDEEEEWEDAPQDMIPLLMDDTDAPPPRREADKPGKPWWRRW
jgi:hypothetical protein